MRNNLSISLKTWIYGELKSFKKGVKSCKDLFIKGRRSRKNNIINVSPIKKNIKDQAVNSLGFKIPHYNVRKNRKKWGTHRTTKFLFIYSIVKCKKGRVKYKIYSQDKFVKLLF